MTVQKIIEVLDALLIYPKAAMPALPSSLISSLSQAPPATVPETAAGLPAALVSLPDPRARRGVRYQLTVVVTAAVCAVVAGYRSYTAIAEWVADVPASTVLALGMDPDRRPSEAMIRRLLQGLDPTCSPPRSAAGWPAEWPQRSRRPDKRSRSTARPCEAPAAARAQPGT